MSHPKIRCPHCHGSGKSHLDPALSETFSLLGRQWESTNLVFQHHDNPWQFGQTAISNRLKKLLSLKLVECQSRGKAKYWRRKLSTT